MEVQLRMRVSGSAGSADLQLCSAAKIHAPWQLLLQNLRLYSPEMTNAAAGVIRSLRMFRLGFLPAEWRRSKVSLQVHAEKPLARTKLIHHAKHSRTTPR